MKIKSLGTPDAPAMFDDMIELNEYLLVVSPPDLVCDATWERKNLLRRLIGSFDGESSKAHFTLYHRVIPPEFDKPFRQAIRDACAEFAPFRIRLNDVRHFDEKVIYWAAEDTSAIDALRTRIVSLSKAMSRARGGHSKETKVPHQTIAAGLEPDKFAIAWEQLKNDLPSFEWTVREVLLLRRNAFVRSRYDDGEQFALGGGGEVSS